MFFYSFTLVNFSERVTRMPPTSTNKTAHSGFETQKRRHQCYVMLWPALTWRGQEWAQHVQGQLLHTSIMQAAGSSHVMELLTDSI